MRNMKLVSVLSMAAIMTLGASFMSFAATGWKQSGNTWYYENTSGDNATETWKKSGDNWFYLGSDGKMLTNQLVEDDDNYYYVNGDGVMITNQWVKTQAADDEEEHWYYFQSNGKAYKKGSSDKANLKEINGKKYIFDEDGRMVYGWVNESGEQADEDDSDAWKEAVYYCGSEDDGAVTTGWISLDVDTEDDDDYQGYYWFYFNQSNGKKVKDETSKTINGKKYGFDEFGAMLYEWAPATDSNASSSVADYKYYQDYDNGVNKRSGWFLSVPAEDVDPEGYEEGDERWFYANSNGSLKYSTLSTINGKKYAFDEYGKMMYGLRGLKLSGSTIDEYTDELESLDDIEAAESEGFNMYYFGDSDDGSMRKSGTTLEIDGEKYKYEFKSNGEGRHGIYKDVIYVAGRRIEADSDQGYAIFAEDGTEMTSEGGYLVNTSGKIQKNKKNVKDKDDMYYCTDKDGIVTYIGSEKNTNK